MLETGIDVTVHGAIVGTMQYMAPEQLEAKDVTPQTDIFAFGAVLYEMLTGLDGRAERSEAVGLARQIMASAPGLF
jgi:serine/threonine protein kinase